MTNQLMTSPPMGDPWTKHMDALWLALERYMAAQNLSRNTIHKRLKTLRTYADWRAANPGVSDVDWVHDPHLSPYGQYDRWCLLRAMLRFVDDRGAAWRGWIFGADWKCPSLPKRPAPQPAPFFDPLTVKRILEQLRLNFPGLYYYLSATLYLAMLRKTECLNLEVGDLHLDARPAPYLEIRNGKGRMGGKSRLVEISLPLRDLLRKYLEHRAGLLALTTCANDPPDDSLWVTPNGHAATTEHWAGILRIIYHGLGLQQPRLPRHHLRRAGAQHAYAEADGKPAIPLLRLQEALGHSKPEQTAVYASAPLGRTGKGLASFQPDVLGGETGRTN